MRDTEYQAAVDFIVWLFSDTEHDVELRSFVDRNAGSGAPKALFGRDGELIDAHCKRFDEAGRGMYYGVCTRQSHKGRGRREDVREAPAVWLDIDTYQIGIEKQEAISALLECTMPPSAIIDSGGGIQALWKLTEPEDVSVTDGRGERDVLDAVRGLVAVFAGDSKVIDLARVLRLPGTINAKHGEPVTASLLHQSDADYELSDILEWLDYQRPIIESALDDEDGGVHDDNNPFLAFAAEMGDGVPLDVAKMLTSMTYGGDGDTSIHQTQLKVSASLVSKGEMEDEEIVELILDATRAAAGPEGSKWRWSREEKNIRNMIATARSKFGPEGKEKKRAEKAQRDVERGSEAKLVSGDATQSQKRRGKPTDDEYDQVIQNVGKVIVADWWQFIKCNSKGDATKATNNLLVAIGANPLFRDCFRRDLLSDRVIVGPVPWERGELIGDELRDSDITSLRSWFERGPLAISIGKDAAWDVVERIADQRAFSPVADYLNGLAWDGKERIGIWLVDYMGADDNIYSRLAGRAWLIGAARRALMPGCQMDYMLILEGEQGIGKSSAARALCPQQEWFTDNLPGLNSRKESLEALLGHWICEVGELASLRKSEINEAKAFLTSVSDNFRPAYGRAIRTYPRRCVFLGTVNDDGTEHFRDASGNRRYWLVNVERVDIDRLKEDRDQIWAEAVAAVHAGELPFFKDEEAIAIHEAVTREANAHTHDSWADIARRYITHMPAVRQNAFGESTGVEPMETWSLRSEPLERVRMAEFIRDAIGTPEARIDRQMMLRAANVWRNLGWKKGKVRPVGGGVPVKHFLAPNAADRRRGTYDEEGGHNIVSMSKHKRPERF